MKEDRYKKKEFKTKKQKVKTRDVDINLDYSERNR